MRISLTHSTVYRYEGPVYLEPQTFRMRPREDAAQRLWQYALEISPAPAGKTECLDQDGNVALEAWFDRPVEQLSVRSSFEVETLRSVLARAHPERLRLQVHRPLVLVNGGMG